MICYECCVCPKKYGCALCGRVDDGLWVCGDGVEADGGAVFDSHENAVVDAVVVK